MSSSSSTASDAPEPSGSSAVPRHGSTEVPPVASPPRRIAWRPAVGIVLGIALFMVVVNLLPDFDPQIRQLLNQLLPALAAGLLALWWIFASRGNVRARVVSAVVLLLLVVAFVASIRRVGLTGDFVFDFTWRWSPDVEHDVAALVGNASAQRVDLRATTPHDFPQFLGPMRDARVPDVRLERDWAAHPPRLLWRQLVGTGWSGFAVVGPYALTQEQRGEQQLVVCYELETGRIRWIHTEPSAYHSVIAGDGPRATPTVADGRVYTVSVFGQLTCLDGATGEVVWTTNFRDDTDAPPPEWGYACSPLVLDNVVVVTPGALDGRSLVAYDRHTGAYAWGGGNDVASYSSPALATLAGVPQILVLNHTSVTGHDPQTGAVLWRQPWEGDNAKVTQPTVWEGDKLFVASGYGVGCGLYRLTPGGATEGDAWLVEELWRNKNLKTKFTNVAQREGFVYGLDEGILACVELATGRRLWKSGRYGHGQLLLVDDLLLIQSEPGDVVLVEATPEEHRERGRLAALSNRTWNSPTLAGRYLLVRNDKEAACYELVLRGAP